MIVLVAVFFFFQAEDGIRDLVRSRGLGDVYKRQTQHRFLLVERDAGGIQFTISGLELGQDLIATQGRCLLYTSDAADERSSVDLGGRRIIKKKKNRSKWRIECMDTHSQTR